MLGANGPVRGTACYDNLAVQGYGFVPLLHQKSTLRATQLTDGRFCHLCTTAFLILHQKEIYILF